MPEMSPRKFGETAVDTIERREGLDPLAERVQQAVIRLYEAGGDAGRRVRDFLHGVWLGHPLHPILTDIPLGAWTVAAALDLAGRTRHEERAADSAVAIGLVGAVGSAITGLTDWQHTAGAERRSGLVHGLLNASATVLYATSLGFRMRGARSAGRTAAGIGFALAAVAGYVGGHLVYKRRVGVDHAPRVEWDDFVTALADHELRDGTCRRVDLRGVAIVLVRRAGRIYALADTCAHLGGPLSEGQVDDVSIRCPWHGSRFGLADGQILEGPSTFTQPAFETRVRDGRIEVRPRR
jgi:nitrite reductase/ring-hydroxylating ferredoxin subunit/uncharacterized membrane protein